MATRVIPEQFSPVSQTARDNADCSVPWFYPPTHAIMTKTQRLNARRVSAVALREGGYASAGLTSSLPQEPERLRQSRYFISPPLRWVFCLLISAAIGYVGLRAAPALAQATVTPNPCYVDGVCTVVVEFETQDPEQDPLTITFSASPAGYTVTGCELDGEPGTPTPPYLTCTTPASLAGPGTHTAVGNYSFSSATTYTTQFNICDDSGHCTLGEADARVISDNTPPSQVNLTLTPPITNANFTLTWTAATDPPIPPTPPNDPGSGLSHYEMWRAVYNSVNCNGTTMTGCTWVKIGADIPAGTLTTTDSPVPGVFWYGIHAVDNVGNWSAELTSRQGTKDVVAPAVPTCVPAAGTYGSTQSVTCTGVDQGSPTTAVTVRYTQGIPTDPTCTSSAWVNPTSISSTTSYRMRSCDAAGNQSTVVVYTYTIDTSAPTFTFSPSVRPWASSNISVLLTATDSGGVSYARYCWTTTTCDPGIVAVNSPPFACNGSSPCSATVTQSGQGTWTLCARARNPAGLWTTPAVCNSPYQKDSVAPGTVLNVRTTPTSPTNNVTPTWLWDAAIDPAPSSGIASYTLNLYKNGTYLLTATTSATSWLQSNNGAGDYTLFVYATDVALNQGGTGSGAVTIDTTAPLASTCVPGTGTYSPSVSVTCTAGLDQGTPTTAVSVRFTSGPTTPPDPTCTSATFTNPTVYSTTTTLKVRTCDAAGNFSAVTTYTYTISGASPVGFTFTPGPSATWSAAPIAITLGVTSPNGITSARYAWDPLVASSTVGTVYTNGTVINSPAGDRTLTVWARDGAGNTNTSSQSPYRYDDTNPTTVSVTSITPNPNNTGTHTVDWTDSIDTQSLLASYDVYQSLNGGAYLYQSTTSAATSQWPSSNLPAGSYTYQIVAWDNVGRSSISGPSAAVIVDKIAPLASSCVPGTGTYSPNVSVTCTAGLDQGSPTTAVTVRHTTTGVDPSCASSAFTNPTVYGATTTLKVRTCDAAGNSSAVTTYTYTISLGSRSASLNINPIPPSGVANTPSSVSLMPTCTPEGGQTLQSCTAQVNVNTAGWGNVASPYPATYNMSSGNSYQFRAREQDTGGSIASAAVPTPAFQLDATAPSVTSFAPQTTPTSNQPVLNWTSTETGGGAIAEFELWRATYNSGNCNGTTMTGCVWALAIDAISASATSQTDTTLSVTGRYWYGLHAVDTANNCITESGTHCGGVASDALDPRISFGPDQVVYDITAPTPNPPTVTPSGQTLTAITWTLSTGSDTPAGLHATPYGFSATSGGPYAFQATAIWNEASLTCGTSYTRYGVIRDALGNQTAQEVGVSSTLSCGSGRSATLSGSPSVSGWTNIATFTYSPTCTAQGGTTLTSCTTEVSTTQGTSWSSISVSQAANQTYAMASGGRYRFRTVELDTGGTITSTSVPTSGDIRVDTTAPTQVTLTLTGTPTKTSFTLSWTDASDAQSGLDHYELWRAPNNGGVPGTWAVVPGQENIPITTLSVTDTPTSSGIWWYGVHAVDKVSNWSTEVTAQQGTYDTVAPVASNHSPAIGGTVTELRPALSVTVSDNLTGITTSTLTVKQGTTTVLIKNFTSGTAVLTISSADWDALGTGALDNAAYSVQVVSNDGVGNQLSNSSWTFTVNNAAPAKPIVQ